MLQSGLPKDSSWGQLSNGRQVLIGFEAPDLKDISAVQQILEECGGHLGSYIPENSVLAVASLAALVRINALQNVTLVGLCTLG